MLKFNLILFALIFFNLSDFNFALVKDNENTRSQTLRDVAKKVKESLNKDTNMCDGATKHVCNENSLDNRIRTKPLNERNHQEIINLIDENDPQTSKSEIKLKNFLKSCENQNNKEQFKNLDVAKLIGGWPLMTPNWNENDFDWVRTLGILNIQHGISGIFNILNYESNSENQGRTLTINFMPEVSDPKEIAETLEIFGIEQENSRRTAKEISEFVESLDINSIPSHSRHSVTVSVSQLKDQLKNFDLIKYIQVILDRPSNSPTTPIDITLSRGTVNDMQNLINHVNNADKRAVANFMMWRVASGLQRSVNQCVIDSTTLSPIVAKIFMEKMMTETDQMLAMGVIEELQNSMKQLKNKISDYIQKYVAEEVDDGIEKLKNCHTILHNDELHENYKEMDMNVNNYLQNQMNIHKQYVRQRMTMGESYAQKKRFGNIFYLKEILNKIQENNGMPAAVYFGNMAYEFWLNSVLVDTGYFNYEGDTVNCMRNVLNMHNQNRSNNNDENDIEDLIMHNEASRLTYHNFENFIQKHRQINENDNQVLAENGLNNRKLLALLLTQRLCANRIKLHRNTNTLFDAPNNDVVVNVFDCPDEHHSKCQWLSENFV